MVQGDRRDRGSGREVAAGRAREQGRLGQRVQGQE